MPQMKPLNWLYLFLMFTLIMVMINMFNFFSIKLMFNTNQLNNSMKKNSFNKWKW